MTQLEFFTALANGAKWGVPASISRSGSANGGLPIDAYSIFDSKAKAELYASQNKTAVEAAGMVNNAYVGQIVTVWEKVPVIGEDGQPTVDENGQAVTADDVSVYYIDADKTLKPVGIVPTGDGATIEVTAEGAISLAGFTGANTGYLPRKAEDGTLEWVPISAVVQGDGNTITTLTSSDGSVTIEKTTDTDTSLVYDLKVATYDDSDVKGRLDTIEADYLKAADKYNDTEVRELIADLDEAIGTSESGLVKDVADNKAAIEAEAARAAAKETELAKAIEDIDFIDEDELAEALEPINTALAGKAAQADLEALQDRVDAFLTGEGTEAALDSLQELIEYIDAHDGADLTEMIATINAIEGKLAGIDSTVVAYVTAAIDALKIGDYAKAADLTALAGRVEVLEAKPFDTYATKTEVQGVDAKFANYTNTSDLNTALTGKVNTSDFDTFKDENTAAIDTAKSEAIAAAAEAVEDAGYAVATDVAETYATKDELAGVKTTADAAATKSYVDTELGKKANADVVYTKSEIDLKIGTPGTPAVGTEGEDGYVAPVNGTGVFASTYSKAELNTMLDKIEGGSTESAASVARQLETYISTNNNRVTLIEQKDTAQDTAIETAQTQADKGVSDAAKAQSTADSTASALAILTDGAVKTNTNDISTIKGIVGIGSDPAATSHAVRIGKLEAADASHSAEFNALKGRVDANEGLIANKANTADVYTKTTADGLFAPKADTYTKTEVDEAVAAAITGANLGTYAKVTDVEAIYKAGVDGGEATGVLADEIARASAAEKANADAIAVLNGVTAENSTGDTGKSVRTIAAEETAKIVANADADYDTLKEIADYIASDKTNAANINNTLAAHSTILAGIGSTEDEHKSVTAYVADYVTDALEAVVQPKASTEISVAADGTLGINEMNVSKLKQTAGDVLILNGGSAV